MNTVTISGLRRLVGSVCVLALASTASGQTLTWDGSTGNWDTDSSWLPGASEPTSTDDVIIDIGLVTVSLPGEVSAELAMDGGAMVIQLSLIHI